MTRAVAKKLWLNGFAVVEKVERIDDHSIILTVKSPNRDVSLAKIQHELTNRVWDVFDTFKVGDLIRL